jgi:ribosome-associated translation inhibitor RaiA
MDDKLELGGSIELSGFSSLDGGVMIVLKKIVGNWAAKLSDKSKSFERLSLTMKIVHAKEKSEIYELHCKLIDNGKVFASSAENRNLFLAIDSALKKVQNEMK